jgi:hypothetical protein
MKPILLFDIDKTLFDTNKFMKIIIYNKFTELLDLNFEQYLNIYNGYETKLKKGTDFLPRSFISSFSHTKNYCYEKLNKTFFNSDNFNNSIYPDVYTSLTRLSERFNLGIYSEGNSHFQTNKLKLSNLYKLFNPSLIFIFRRKTTKNNQAKLPPGSTVIDDNLDVINSINVSRIWLNRKDQSTHPTIKTIYSLLALTSSG